MGFLSRSIIPRLSEDFLDQPLPGSMGLLASALGFVADVCHRRYVCRGDTLIVQKGITVFLLIIVDSLGSGPHVEHFVEASLCHVSLRIMDPNVVTVPQRYIRYDQTQIQTNSSSVISSDQKIPVIDFQNLLLDNSELYESELNKLHSACKEWGFFQLVNHGVSNSLVEKLKQGVEELFKLPIEEKKKLWRKQGDKEGFGDPGVLTDEQILDWKDIITNGIYLSNEHRAIVNSTDERMSIATFLNSNEDCEIGPSHSLITQQNPAIYKTMSSKDYIKSMFSREYNGKSHIDAFKL
uniref:Non-haem dioxygenase N-terminal domain-containing protein n=1 Tax=Cannabis sativa TaxID=3483 RepID=A0A803NPU2_CANSA